MAQALALRLLSLQGHGMLCAVLAAIAAPHLGTIAPISAQAEN